MSPDLNWVKRQRVCLGNISWRSLLSGCFPDSALCKGIQSDSTGNCNDVMTTLSRLSAMQNNHFKYELSKIFQLHTGAMAVGNVTLKFPHRGGGKFKCKTVQKINVTSPATSRGGGGGEEACFQLTSALLRVFWYTTLAATV